ncbi:Endonuclease/exonuclease/phosphatase, partial [Cinara cedri]
IQQKPVTANVSYAQIASTSKVDPKSPQPKGNKESITLNDILVALTNITQTLTNITSRMDKLEINQINSKNTSQKIKGMNSTLGRARVGTAVIIKESIKNYELEKYFVNHIQATSVSVNDGNNDLTIAAIYCPPQGGADEIKFTEFHTLGSEFIVGGHYNAKHTHRGSRLITPKR